MNELDNQTQRHLDFLLADFSATKAEIARRSNLQRVVLAAYATVIALVCRETIAHTFNAIFIVGLWIATSLSLNFYHREGKEIERLGAIVRERIAQNVSKILQVQLTDLVPSQTNNKYPKIDKLTSRYNRQFGWTLFFGLPCALTTLYLSQDWTRLNRLFDFHTRAPYLAIMVFFFAVWTICLLWINVGIKHQNDA